MYMYSSSNVQLQAKLPAKNLPGLKKQFSSHSHTQTSVTTVQSRLFVHDALSSIRLELFLLQTQVLPAICQAHNLTSLFRCAAWMLTHDAVPQ